MTEGERVVSFGLQYSIDDPDGQGWPVVPLSVGQDVVLDMPPNILARRSSLSRRALDDLRRRGLVADDAPPFLLRDLRIIGQPVPPVSVRVGGAGGLLGADGVLGFDFFGQFRRIILEPRTLTLTLVVGQEGG